MTDHPPLLASLPLRLLLSSSLRLLSFSPPSSPPPLCAASLPSLPPPRFPLASLTYSPPSPLPRLLRLLAAISAFRSFDFGAHEAISLSAPFDALFADAFQKILLTRRSTAGVGWAAAEHHCLQPDSASFDVKAGKEADKNEKAIAGSYKLPADPMGKLSKPTNNYPILAFSYLLRRFVMCPRFCLICFKTVDQTIIALKPFVCDSQLCLFQLISLGLGPSLEHEIKTNAPAVDLLIPLAYTSANENALKGEHQPQGLSLEVPANSAAAWTKGNPTVEFDWLDQFVRNSGVVALIGELSSVPDMKMWLTGEDLTNNDRLLNRNRKVVDMRDGSVSNSAWKLLRWIVASNTSYLKQIEEGTSSCREYQLKTAIEAVQQRNANAQTYLTLYAWHGSAVKKPDPFVPASAERLKLIRLLPPPTQPDRSASLTIHREMRTMMAVQEAKGPTEAGYYFDPERSNDNIFTWVVELIGFDPDLPLMKDMKSKGVKSLLFEIRFGDSYPHSPPFFRLVHPRFLPFIHGGGGHVTGGGSICMDLLTPNGWNPIYQIEAVLLQIRMAISNLEPRPARLDPQSWDKPYTISDAVEGFKRAANTHGWSIPDDLDKLTRAY